MSNTSNETLSQSLEAQVVELAFLEEVTLEYVGGGTITNTL